MAAGNITNYQTSLGVSTNGLRSGNPVGAPIGGPDGWYSDGVWAYYVAGGSVQSYTTDPCPTPAPPPPITYDYYDYEQCTGAKKYLGVMISIQVASGTTPPNSITYGAYCWAISSSSNPTPTYNVVGYTSPNCNCA